MRRSWRAAALAVCLSVAGCGRDSEKSQHAFLISGDEAWRVGRDRVEQVKTALEQGNLDRFHRLLALATRKEFTVEALRKDYEKRCEEIVNRVRTTKLLHVIPPSLESPFVDLKISHFDGSAEWWRLVHEEKTWRILRMGRTIVELEYNQ